MSFSEEQIDKAVLKADTEVCSTCGKPKILAKARSDVTRYLAMESRCMCDEARYAEAASLQPELVVTPDTPPLGSDPLDEIVEKNLGDKYEVEQLLGRGGMGAVYRVRHKALGKVFAVKVLNPQLMKDAASLKRFEQEASAASKLTHANLAAVYDYGKGDAGAPFIVMDYLDGKSLDDVIKTEGYLDQPRALDLLIQAAEAISHAHMKGLIHRDIKPANLIVTNHNGAELLKLVDFGIAKVVSHENAPTQNLTQTGEIFGSPMYMSPEQCQGMRLDARSDIYSFGCVMYEALMGSPPFRGDNPIQTILKHINATPDSFEQRRPDLNLLPGFDAIVMRCLEKDPDMRYQTMDQLREDLVALHDGRPLKAKPSRKVVSRDVSISSRPVVVGLLSCTAVLIGIVAWQNLAPPAVTPVTAVAPVTRPLSLTGDALHDAQELDRRSYEYFQRGEYEKAIPLLEFGVKTYREGGSGLGRGGEDNYLADNYSHIGKCYLNLKNWTKAAENYREALKIYNKLAATGAPMMSEAVSDYATVLRSMGRETDATAMLRDFQASRTVKKIP